MTNILILGGTAWLGREIARAAVARGDTVTCLARGEAGEVADGVRLVRADRADPRAYDEVSGRDWDDVVDVSWNPAFVRGAVAALGDRATHWTYVSSCSVYADHDTPGVDEDTELMPPLENGEPTWEVYGEAKSACEAAVVAGLGDRALLARSGLIGGPGDGSDRFGYWVSRFALAGDGPVLVPDIRRRPSQLIDVRDMAAWLLRAGSAGVSGPVNAVGARMELGDLLDEAAGVADFGGDVVPASVGWLEEHEVSPWSGPRSLPLWLPAEGHAGFAARDDRRALAAGLERRAMVETLRDTLAYERVRGLDRDRKAGLTRAEELDLITQLR